MVISHSLQNIFQTVLCVTGRTLQLLHLREEGIIFYHDTGKFDPPCSRRKLEIWPSH